MPRTIGAILDRQEQLEGVVFDLVAERKTTRARQVTSHAIETGTQISDHVLDDNIVVSFQAEIGNIDLLREYTPTEKSNDAYKKLVTLFSEKTIIDYQTGFELFQNMIITSLDFTERMEKPGALLVDVVLEQIDITESEQVLIPQSILGLLKIKKQLSSEVNRGKQDLGIAERHKVLNIFSRL